VVATEKHLPSVLYTVRSFPHSLKVKVKSSRLIAYIGRSEESPDTPDRVKKSANRYVGDGPQVDNSHHSGTMPLFVQLASKADVAEDQLEASVDSQMTTLSPASDLPQAYVDPLPAGFQYGMRLARPASLQ
jgi:hypothetical protein